MLKRYLSLLLFFITIDLFSQSNLNINNVDVSDLSTEDINSIFIDKKGFNWISTNEGLNRFDGLSNSIFRSNPFDNKTISDNSTKFSFQVDTDGIFVSTNSGMDYFRYENLSFDRLELNSSPTGFYNYLNYLFIPTQTEGLFVYELENDTILEDFKFDPRNPLSISSSQFNDTQNDVILFSLYNEDSALWVGTSNGLNKIDLNTKSNKRYYSEGTSNSLPSNFIYDIYSYDSLILVSTDNGLALVNKLNNSISHFNILDNKEVYNIFEIFGKLIIHTQDGVFKIDDLENEILTPIYLGYKLKSKVINDNEFVVWSENANVERIFFANSEFYTQNLNKASNLEINDINNFKGAYYISSKSGILKVTEKINNILSVFDRDEKILTMVENDFYRVVVTDQNLLIYEEDELSYEYVLEELLPDQSIGTPSLLLDEDLLYIGTDRLNVFDLYTEEITVFQNSTSGFNSILSGNINNLSVIVRENKKELWISLNTGISVFDVDGNKFQNFQFNQRSNKNKFPNGFSSLLLSKKYELWLTNSESGLYKYNPETLELVKHYIFDINDKTSITSSSLSSITEYNDELYVGSSGDGLYVYVNDSSGFKNINVDNGLLSNNVNAFLKTYQYLFILSDKGINYFDFEVMSTLTDGNNNNLRNINIEDGLDPNKILDNGISFFNDLIYVFSENKIQKIDLYNLFVDRENPIINLTLSELIDENFDKREFKIVDNKIDLTDEVSNVELSLSSPSYYKPQSTQIFYKIEELNDEWVNLGKERKLIIQSSGYSNSFINGNKILAPYGKYNLRIKSANSSGIESINQLEYELTVKPPWYLTTFAFISYFFIIVSIIFFYVKFSQGRTKKLMEEKRKEEELEEAHNLQMGLLAKENPDRADLDISTYIRCATEVGGDYYDFIEFEDGSLLAKFFFVQDPDGYEIEVLQRHGRFK